MKEILKENQLSPNFRSLNFTKFSQDVFKELNLARTNPAFYSKKLTKIQKSMEDKIIKFNDYGIYMSEGEAGINEAIKFLKKQPHLEPLIFSSGISKCSEELLNLLMLHEGISDMTEFDQANYDLEKRMNHFGAAFGELSELIEYGTYNPEFVIINLIVCDGDPQRRERQIIFNPYYKYTGISSGLLPSEKVCTVINLSELFFNPGESIPEKILFKYTNKESFNNYNRDKFLIQSNNIQNTKAQLKTNDNINENINLIDKKNDVIQNYLSKTTQNYSTNFSSNQNIDEINDIDIPEGVEKIQYTEKIINDKNKTKTVIKKTTYYTNGILDTIIYNKV